MKFSNIVLYSAATLCAALASGCDLDGGKCSSHKSTTCVLGELWWLDSCGKQEEFSGYCPCGCNADSTGCLEPCDCTPDCRGRACGSDPVCGTLICGNCPVEAPICNAQGQCVAHCTPDCQGRACGMDPVCGTLSCGTCPAEAAICNAQGQCVSQCTPDCGNRECGMDPECGTLSCGTCPAEAPTCNAQGRCISQCTPNCRGRACGMDPVCGTQSCGTCPAETPTCNAEGQCVSQCTPDCGDRECGMDPVCGARNCGACPAEAPTCNDQGMCEAECVPDCGDRECGMDPECGAIECGQCYGPTPHCNASGMCDSDTGYSGPEWTVVYSRNQPPLSTIYGIEEDEIWAADSSGCLYLWNGDRWNQASEEPLHITSFWGSAADNIWAVGYRGVCHYDGSSWDGPTPVPGFNGSMSEIWARGPSDIWASGSGGKVLHYDGNGWSVQQNGPATTSDLWTITGTSSGKMWAATGYDTFHYNGSAWVQYQGSPDEFRRFWTSPEDEVFGLTQYGIYRLSENSFVFEYSAPETVREIWGLSSTDLWVAGLDGTLLHRGAGGAWSAADGPSSSWSDYAAVFGVRTDAIWVSVVSFTGSAPAEIWLWDGSNWNDVRDSPTDDQVVSMSGTAGDDIWAAGSGGDVLHYDGSSWTRDDLPAGSISPIAIFACARGEAWVVGHTISKVYRHTTQAGWEAVETGEQEQYGTMLSSIWGPSCSDMWALGKTGDGSAQSVVLHWSNGSFEREMFFNFQNGSTVVDLFGFGSNDIWGIADTYRFVHYDGAVWSEVYDGNMSGGAGIWGAAADDVWAAEGGDFGFRHFTGGEWIPVYDAFVREDYGDTYSIYLSGLWGRAADDIWAVGNDGERARALHYDGEAWREAASPCVECEIHSVWGSASGFWAGGSDGLILRVR